MKRRRCPACGSTELSSIYRADNIPVQSCILLETEDEALAFPRADLALAACGACGFIFNEVFDSALVDYAAATEESQHFSGTFNRFAARLVEEIAAAYDLREKTTLEIGCGKGDFLIALSKRTGTIGVGVDPGFIPERTDVEGVPVTFQREYFSAQNVAADPDFVVCRHTLEHIANVGEFVADIRDVIADRTGVGLFFETPDAGRVLVEGAFWDIYYEHCSYFTPGSHARLFRHCALPVTRLSLDYADQYIIQYAQTGAPQAPSATEDDLRRVRRLTREFPERVAAELDTWRAFVRDRCRSGKRVALWGGGSKAVAFLTTTSLGEAVADVVDINPYKQGRHLPGAGHRVVAPEALMDDPPDTVIAMNGIYLPEIGEELSRMGLTPELAAV